MGRIELPAIVDTAMLTFPSRYPGYTDTTLVAPSMTPPPSFATLKLYYSATLPLSPSPSVLCAFVELR